jgi:hypothetical protein
MSEYAIFPIDFINRTRENLEKYSGKYEVTNLINCCLGLIIIPKQKLKDKMPKYVFNNEDNSFGITKSNIPYEEKSNFDLSNVLRHIRNGLAHGRIDQKTHNCEIVGLRIHDKLNENENENFVIEFSIEEFKNFAVKISDLFRRNY